MIMIQETPDGRVEVVTQQRGEHNKKCEQQGIRVTVAENIGDAVAEMSGTEMQFEKRCVEVAMEEAHLNSTEVWRVVRDEFLKKGKAVNTFPSVKKVNHCVILITPLYL